MSLKMMKYAAMNRDNFSHPERAVILCMANIFVLWTVEVINLINLLNIDNIMDLVYNYLALFEIAVFSEHFFKAFASSRLKQFFEMKIPRNHYRQKKV